MKTTQATFFRAIFFGSLLLFLNACHKAAETQPYQVTEQDAAGVIANNLLPLYGGFISQVNNSLSIRQTAPKFCGLAKDTTLSAGNLAAANIIFHYSLSWHYQYDCSGHVLSVNYAGPCNDEGAVYISTDNATASLTLSEPSGSTWQLSASQQRTGQQRIKGIGSNAFNSAVGIETTDLMIDPVSKNILSGIAKVAMTGTSGSNFNYTGTFTFSGGNKGILVLNSGKTYYLNW